MTEAPISRDLEVHKELVERVLASSHLSKSARLTHLFVYLCRRVVDEDVQEIHELELGHKVFGRPSRYDTTADNIVRVHASLLRKRLSEYFLTDGCEEDFCIEIPRGNYAPVFRKRNLRELKLDPPVVPPSIPGGESVSGVEASAVSGIDARRRLPSWVRSRWLPAGLAMGFATLSLVLFLRLQHAGRVEAVNSPAMSGTVRQFWSGVFQEKESVDVVLDDASLGLYEEATGQPIALAEYFDRGYLRSLDASGSEKGITDHPAILLHDLVIKRQSNYADAVMVWKLAQTASLLRSDAKLQFARDVSFRQTKSGNLILLGDPESDPWIQLFESSLSLHWKFDPVVKAFYPVDTATPADAERFHSLAENSKTREAYATISFLPNLSNTGNVLIVSGTGGAATDAAMDMLLDESSLERLRSRLQSSSSSSFPYFEALVRIEKGSNLPRNVTVPICRALKFPRTKS